jgi:hypothetical protein
MHSDDLMGFLSPKNQEMHDRVAAALSPPSQNPYYADAHDEPDDRTDRLIEEMDSLLRQVRGFLVRRYADDPEMPEIVDEIDAFLEGK